MSDYGEIPIFHSIEKIDNKYKDKSVYRDTYYDYDDHTDTFTALNNHKLSIPFPTDDKDYGNSL